MKKILLLGAFALLGASSAFAGTVNFTKIVKTDFGSCEISVYKNGKLVGYTIVYASSESDCNNKAREYASQF